MESITEIVLTSQVRNRVYYSSGNSLSLYAELNSLNDWFNCSWSMVPKPITTNFKRNHKLYIQYFDMFSTVVRLFRFLFLVCRDHGATSANGTIQPLVENSDVGEERRFCLFFIQALPFQQIKFSCSFLDFSWINRFAVSPFSTRYCLCSYIKFSFRLIK